MNEAVRVRLRPDGSWWVCTLECHCWCGRYVRAAFGKTAAAAVDRFRVRRREEWRAAMMNETKENP